MIVHIDTGSPEVGILAQDGTLLASSARKDPIVVRSETHGVLDSNDIVSLAPERGDEPRWDVLVCDYPHGYASFRAPSSRSSGLSMTSRWSGATLRSDRTDCISSGWS